MGGGVRERGDDLGIAAERGLVGVEEPAGGRDFVAQTEPRRLQAEVEGRGGEAM